jgi:hypothetical protein
MRQSFTPSGRPRKPLVKLFAGPFSHPDDWRLAMQGAILYCGELADRRIACLTRKFPEVLAGLLNLYGAV